VDIANLSSYKLILKELRKLQKILLEIKHITVE
jgi:hypothetical protein